VTSAIPIVVAAAGRRIDKPRADAERFPLRNLDRVGRAIHEALAAIPVIVLVSSAACGADLLALEAAGTLGIRRRVILPFDVDRFRDASVIDRPGNWGTVFDAQIAEVQAAGDLIVLDAPVGDAAYAHANAAILDEGDALAASAAAERVALIAWDGSSRGPDDVTAHFRDEALSRRWRVQDIPTA
jgi:hypothetical protein